MRTPEIRFDRQIKYGSEYGPDEERAVLGGCCAGGSPTSGEACIQFEKECAAYCGAASVQDADEKNTMGVAGLVNGIGSLGSIVQEQVIGWLVRGDVQAGMRKTNRLALAMSILMALLLGAIAWHLHVIERKRRAGRQPGLPS